MFRMTEVLYAGASEKISYEHNFIITSGEFKKIMMRQYRFAMGALIPTSHHTNASKT